MLGKFLRKYFLKTKSSLQKISKNYAKKENPEIINILSIFMRAISPPKTSHFIVSGDCCGCCTVCDVDACMEDPLHWCEYCINIRCINNHKTNICCDGDCGKCNNTFCAHHDFFDPEEGPLKNC
jgi:hypothetical protein